MRKFFLQSILRFKICNDNNPLQIIAASNNYSKTNIFHTSIRYKYSYLNNVYTVKLCQGFLIDW